MPMTVKQSVFPGSARVILCGAFLCLAVCLGFPAGASESDSTLREMRAQRRTALRQASLAADKSGASALFGLLVIPVDFPDARLPSDWNSEYLSRRLNEGSGESLRNYFSVASGQRMELRVTQAPVIHLPGTRRDYSDVGYNGFTRTRALATESLVAVRDLGLEFRRLDMDGPDGIPGTDDDDGEVDGVLILHAGPGQENDPIDGLIQALQFFLEEPVVSQGVSATFYAVASLQSGPGIWAHETAHLLGLEDRYDPLLRPSGGSEVLSLGGLGRFSLMASGAWGTGDGYGAALPDAYSCLQLGWYEEHDLSLSTGTPDTLFPGQLDGRIGRLWTKGIRGPEYFLMETRDPAASAPFDADVPGGHLLVYHVDESLPEGQTADDGGGDWHLRVGLVEADDDGKLKRGQDPGRPEDLFPGPLGKTDFGPLTTPSSWGYDGDSGISLSGIEPVPGGVTFLSSAWSDPALEFTVGFSGDPDVFMYLAAASRGTPLANLTCTASIGSQPAWGTFAGGQSSVTFALPDDGTGRWRPAQEIPWYPAASVDSDARTVFTFDFRHEGGSFTETRTWYWKDNAGVLDFAGPWPGTWTISGPGVDTTWHRWDGDPWLTADQTPVLACTGSEFSDPSFWPAVNYQNRAAVSVTSGHLGPEVEGVRLIHAMEVEFLAAGVAMDGGLALWVGPDNQEYPAMPLEGWRGRISPQAVNILNGHEALVQEVLEIDEGIPLWQTDILTVPTDRPGPWRLRLSFGSNTLWRRLGWFVAGLDPILADPAGEQFMARWNTDLTWSWPWGRGNPCDSSFSTEWGRRPHGTSSRMKRLPPRRVNHPICCPATGFFPTCRARSASVMKSVCWASSPRAGLPPGKLSCFLTGETGSP